MRIGIMGGTFDPIHIGHLMLGEFAYESYNLNKVWFLPNGNPPHKANELMNTSLTHRVEMTKYAISQTKHFELSLHEVVQGSVSYSFETMEFFKKEHPQDEFFFILGADSLFSIENWESPERLFRTCTILAAYRDDRSVLKMEQQIQYLKSKYNARISLLSAPLLEISSSTIRQRISMNRSIRYMVPDEVRAYIKDHDLYKIS